MRFIKNKFFLLTIILILCMTALFFFLRKQSLSSPEPDSSVQSHNEPIELIMWVSQNGLNTLEQKFVDEFNSSHPYASIRVVSRPSEVDTDTMASLMSGTAPDILILSDSEVQTYAYLGLLLPLEEYLNSWEGLSEINPALLKRYTFNDHNYAIPCGEYAMGMFYNKAIFKQADITPPDSWTWEEFRDIAVRLTDKENDRYGFALNWNQWGNWWFQMFVWAAGGDLTKKDNAGRLITTFQDPAVTTAGEFYRSLKSFGCIQPNLNAKLDTLKKDFAEGKAAMIYNGMDDIETFLNYGMKLDDIGVLPIPIGPSGQNQTQLGGSAYVMTVGVSPEKRQAVFDYYTLASSKAYYEDFPYADRSDFLDRMHEYEENGRYSFYGNPVLTSFIDEAIQRFMTDENTDIADVFSYYEKEANKQAVVQYNSSFE